MFLMIVKSVAYVCDPSPIGVVTPRRFTHVDIQQHGTNMELIIGNESVNRFENATRPASGRLKRQPMSRCALLGGSSGFLVGKMRGMM
jgi:hypothetical protein